MWSLSWNYTWLYHRVLLVVLCFGLKSLSWIGLSIVGLSWVSWKYSKILQKTSRKFLFFLSGGSPKIEILEEEMNFLGDRRSWSCFRFRYPKFNCKRNSLSRLLKLFVYGVPLGHLYITKRGDVEFFMSSYCIHRYSLSELESLRSTKWVSERKKLFYGSDIILTSSSSWSPREFGFSLSCRLSWKSQEIQLT